MVLIKDEYMVHIFILFFAFHINLVTNKNSFRKNPDMLFAKMLEHKLVLNLEYMVKSYT